MSPELRAGSNKSSSRSQNQFKLYQIRPLIPDPAAEPLQLKLLRTGGDVWNIVEGAQAYVFGDFNEDCTDQEVEQIVAEFLQNARDWGEISDNVKTSGMVAIRETKQSLGANLTALHDRGLLVFGGRERLIIKGGVLPSAYWHQAVIEVVVAEDPRIVVNS